MLKDRNPPGVTIETVLRHNQPAKCQVVKCSKCPNTLPLRNTTKSGGLGHDIIKAKTQQAGWKWNRRGHHVCDRCQAEEKAMNTRPSEAPPREPTAADKRRIFRAIDENYDDVNCRYVGNATDNSMAKELGVPRKWVQSVREENFGPAGNDEMIDAAKVIEEYRDEVRHVVEEALNVAARAEKLVARADELAERVASIEIAVGARPVRS